MNIIEVGDTEYTDRYFPLAYSTVLAPPVGLYENDSRSPTNPLFCDLNEELWQTLETPPQYDIVVATQVLNFLVNPDNGMKNLLDLVKKGGILFLTVASSHPVSAYDASRWGDYVRFMPQGFNRLLDNYASMLEVLSLEVIGNCALTVARTLGLSAEEMSANVWKEQDALYPVVICALIRKL